MEHEKEGIVKKLKQIPISIPLFTTIICVYGFIILYSAAGGNIEPWAYKQIIVFSIFMPVAILISLIDLRLIYNLSYVFYIFTFILLLIVQFFGKSAKGAARWIDLGIFTIQPSELVKISIILMLSRYFHEKSKYDYSNYSLLVPIIASLLSIGLVIKQPDLATGIIAIIVTAGIFFASGIKLIYFIISGLVTMMSMPLIWLSLHNYQRNRILTFLDPERDPLGTGYNIIQSKIAIGSGGLFGKGLINGTQSQLNFLPEHQTDFIFAFLAEELGFFGGALLLLLYSMLMISSLSVAINSRSVFAKLLVIGVTILFFSHVFINIAMVMGLMPAAGIPLPLVSYGRTVMVSMLIGFGFIMNAAVNQRTNI